MPLNYFRLRTLLTFMIVLLVGASVITYATGRFVISANQEIIRQQADIQQLDQTLSDLKDAETGQRGFLITGNESYLQPYNDATSAIRNDLGQLQQEAVAGHLTSLSVAKLAALSQAKLDELSHTIQLRREKGLTAAQTVIDSNAGKITMDDIRKLVATMIVQEQTHLQNLRARADRADLWRIAVFIVCAGGELFFCIWAYYRIISEIERRTAYAAETRRQKDLLSVTLSSIGDAVMVTDVNANVTFMNAVAEALTGWSLSDASGKPVADIFNIINEDSRKTVESPVEKVLRTGRIVGLANHTLLIRKDGSEIPIDDSGAPVRDQDGKVYGVVLVFRDFTGHKNAERSLLLAKAEAEAANRAKDQFLANLSHELRTPLSPVAATLHIWEASEELPEAMRDDVRMLRRNVDLEARLIDDLLDLTKITKGKLSLNLETLDVHDLLTSVMGIVRTDIAAKQLKLSVELGAKDHFVRGDPARLQQVMWNVLKNAVKFSNVGGSISVQTADRADGQFTLTISDTGIGMSEQTLLRLFNPFEQAGDATTRQFGGLGLGLSIAKALVEAQAGSISASSDGPGKGATFTIALPAIPKPIDRETGLIIPAPPKPPIARSLLILLVEDHADTARVMNRILVSLGHQVQVAPSVAAALALFNTRPFDLLLSDLGLPDGTGLDLVKQIHAQRYVPAIALTGFGMEDDVSRSRDAGFCSHLTKPINFQKLEAALLQAADPQPAPN